MHNSTSIIQYYCTVVVNCTVVYNIIEYKPIKPMIGIIGLYSTCPKGKKSSRVDCSYYCTGLVRVL